ncbi:MAG: hypothetical protein HYY40_13945 [Bacteroidetes bacterium]|nr:hypothetical protein [Bacteroidota bacterium]
MSATKNIEGKNSFSLKEKLLYGGGAVVISVGTFFLGRKIVRKLFSNREEKKSFEEENPATYAKRIKMAFENDGWPGTNTAQLRSVLREIPSKQVFTKVAGSYQKLYNSSIYRDLSDELQSTEYNEMLAIINAKPDRIGKKGEEAQQLTSKNYSEWAKRMKAAFDKEYGFFPGTDEEALKAVFDEIPTQAAFIEVGKDYAKLYKQNMLEDLKDEVGFLDYSDWMKTITSKPKN